MNAPERSDVLREPGQQRQPLPVPAAAQQYAVDDKGPAALPTSESSLV
jgi:hypothetical protein